MTITVLYSCPECGLDRVPVQVPARDEENVIVWMEQTGEHLSLDHARRSPNCHPAQLKDIMIPIVGAEKVGGPAVQ